MLRDGNDFAGDADGLRAALQMLLDRTQTPGVLPLEEAKCPLPDRMPAAGLGERVALSRLAPWVAAPLRCVTPATWRTWTRRRRG